MRTLLQRVSEASVTIDKKLTGKIGKGLLILLGIEENDDTQDVQYLAKKIASMRIFPDAGDKMNLDIKEAGGDILVVSQFTLHAETKKGNRPSFIRAARPEQAIPLYEMFIREMEIELNKKIFTGKFGAMMQVQLVNDGPVTIFIDSKEK